MMTRFELKNIAMWNTRLSYVLGNIVLTEQGITYIVPEMDERLAKEYQNLERILTMIPRP